MNSPPPPQKKINICTIQSSYFVFVNYEERNTLDLFMYENFIVNEILQKNFT